MNPAADSLNAILRGSASRWLAEGIFFSLRPAISEDPNDQMLWNSFHGPPPLRYHWFD
jgi:hypothetical protein